MRATPAPFPTRLPESRSWISTRATPEATIVADLSEPNSLPANRFDCFILTQTLQLVADLEAALENAWQSLTSGGVC